MQKNWIKTANVFRAIARYPLLILGILVFIFALLSGSEGYGGGIVGIIKNSPNAIPWMILLLFLLIAWKWELIGGIIITTLGMALFIFFNFRGPSLSLFPFFLTIIMAILGSFFILSWLLRRNEVQTSGLKRLKKGRIVIFYAVIVAICLTLAGLTGYKHNQTFSNSPDKTLILQPKDGARVKQQVPALGIFAQADSSKDLWLMVKSTASAQYYPQPGPLNKPPRRMLWYSTAYFGAPDDAPGQQYHLYLFSATEEASKITKDYLHKAKEFGQWLGMEALPAGLTPLDTVAVVRK